MPKPKSNSPSLARLLSDRDELLSHIKDALDNRDSEQERIAQEVLDSIIRPALATKTDGLAYVIQYALPNQIAELKAFSDAITSKRRAIEEALDGIKERLKYLHSTGRIDKVLKGDISEINIGSGTFSVDDTQAQPAEWGKEWSEFYTTTISYKVDKKAILTAHKAGRLLPPGVEVKPGLRLSVKIKGND